MKPQKNLLLGIHKFFPSLLSLHYERKPRTWKAFVFTVGKLQLKTSQLNTPIPLDMIIFTNPSAQAGYDTRSIFKRSLTGLNSEFSFS